MTIAGAVYPDLIPEESATRRMLSLSRSFPQNVWQEGRMELGSSICKNLSLISDLLIVFDGTLYNPSDQTPEEQIAALYLLHQEQFLSHLNGNFCLALYDQKKQELLLARDRIGEKVVYWTLKNDLFLFANSLKSILASRLVSQTPDLEALSFYVSFGFIPQEKSPIQDVFKLQPGHYLKVTKEKNLLIRPYWSYNLHLKLKNKEIAEEDFKQAVSKAWKQRAISPALCYGENSAIEKEAGVPLQFFQPKQASSESVLEDLHSMIWHLDEPVADLSLPGLWQACKELKLANRSELFFTTGSLPFLQQEIHPPRFFFFKPLSAVEHLLKKKLLIPFFYRLHPKTAYEMLRSIHTHPWHVAFLNQTALFDNREFYDLHSHLLRPVDNEIFLHRFPALERLGPSFSSLMYLYHKIKLPAAIVLPQERFCSHFGIKRVAPYLDVSVLELLASVPDTGPSFSYDKLFNTSVSRVSALPVWTKDIAPRHLMEKLSKSVLVEAGLFSPVWLSEQMKNFNRHPHLFFQELWGLLVLEIWFRLFIERNFAD